MSIKYLKNKEIDLEKWNDCIKNSFNGIVYAYSWYLDIVSEGWEALVNEDYSQVMPLTCNNKLGVDYISQPLFTQQLGVFSKKVLDSDTIKLFIDSIPSNFKYYEIQLNKYNNIENQIYSYTKRVTYELDLISSYDKLYQNYNTNTKRNIKKSSENISVVTGLQPNDFINLLSSFVNSKQINLKDENYNTIRKIISFALRYQIGELVGAYDEKNQLCSAAFFINSHNKAIYLFAASSDTGKELRANFRVIDYYINKYSGFNLTLDFEGSNIEGLARFYSGFGAKACEYYKIKKNSLPWYFKLLKK